MVGFTDIGLTIHNVLRPGNMKGCVDIGLEDGRWKVRWHTEAMLANIKSFNAL